MVAPPTVDTASTADARGYRRVASGGGTFALGDAPFGGSMGDDGSTSRSGGPHPPWYRDRAVTTRDATTMGKPVEARRWSATVDGEPKGRP